MTDTDKINSMRRGGALLAEVLISAVKRARAGMTTLDIENMIAQGVDQSGGRPSFKTVNHYPFYSCVGLNAEVVHSLPSQNKIIKVGDLLKIDAGLIWQGWHTDMSWTVKINPKGEPEFNDPFLTAGKQALAEAISHCRIGEHIGDISRAIQSRIESSGYNVVKQLTGHCIGKKLHEKPYIPGFIIGHPSKTPKIASGMTLAIEIIYSEGNGLIVVENDGWTISTQDDKMSALFEQTVAVTSDLPLILTPVPVDF